MLIIIGGVSGTGKSTIGLLLAKALELPFYDGDDFHPASNQEKMTHGTPLTDADRQPWLEALSAKLALWGAGGGAILACSALKESYRALLASKCSESLNWIMLTGSEPLLRERMTARQGHFMKPAMLRSQLEALELPDYGIAVDVAQSPAVILSRILSQLPTLK